MDYSNVSEDFFKAVTENLPADWRVSSSRDGCAVTQWFEPESNELIAQSVQLEGGRPSHLLHRSYSMIEQQLSGIANARAV